MDSTSSSTSGGPTSSIWTLVDQYGLIWTLPVVAHLVVAHLVDLIWTLPVVAHLVDLIWTLPVPHMVAHLVDLTYGLYQ